MWKCRLFKNDGSKCSNVQKEFLTINQHKLALYPLGPAFKEPNFFQNLSYRAEALASSISTKGSVDQRWTTEPVVVGRVRRRWWSSCCPRKIQFHHQNCGQDAVSSLENNPSYDDNYTWVEESTTMTSAAARSRRPSSSSRSSSLQDLSRWKTLA